MYCAEQLGQPTGEQERKGVRSSSEWEEQKTLPDLVDNWGRLGMNHCPKNPYNTGEEGSSIPAQDLRSLQGEVKLLEQRDRINVPGLGTGPKLFFASTMY